jgi:hypothetical protein
MDSNLKELAEMVCEGGPREIGTIQLELESQTHDYVYNILLLTCKYMCEILFGYQDLTKMSREDYTKLNKYFVALDYTIKVTANHTVSLPWDLIENNETLNSIELAFKKLTRGVDYAIGSRN